MLSLPWTTLARGPWSPEQVVCDYSDQAIHLEPAVRQRVQTLMGNEHNPFFNGLGYRLDEFVLPSDDDKTLRLSLRPTDYFTMLCTDNALDEPITIANKKTTLREHYMVDDDMRIRPPRGIASFAGFTLQLVTGDNKAVLSRRGATATSAHTMFTSLGESCSRPEDELIPGVPDITHAAVRGLYEEYAIYVHESAIEWVAFGANHIFGEYNLLGLVQLDLTSVEFVRYLKAGEDSWEREESHLVTFNPEQVVQFMNANCPWTTLGVATIYEALLARFDEGYVVDSFAALDPSVIDPRL